MVTALGDAVCEIVAGLYVGGSLATGDYRAGVSDIDAVAMLATAPRPGVRDALTAIHEGLANQFEGADALHWLPPVSSEELRHGARAALAGYLSRALRKRALWNQDVYVDLGLTVWARAVATLADAF